MYTEPKIITCNSLKVRSYITFYFNGKRVRIFNGHSLNLKINPNYQNSISDRNKLLEELLFHLKNALRTNSYPAIKKDTETTASTFTVLTEALNRKLASDLSNTYKTDLRSVYSHFMGFLTEAEKSASITLITLPRIELYLTRYNSSGTYYMNKRRTLGVLFNAAGKTLQKTLEVVRETSVRRTNSKLHKIYDRKQLLKILDYLKTHHFNLYLCCLISYGCLLRPHQEIRLLMGSHFKNDFREIHLSGNENKGRKVRVVYVPDYVRSVLQIIPELLENTNLFTLSKDHFNPSYFNTAWSRAWKNMLELVLSKRTIPYIPSDIPQLWKYSGEPRMYTYFKNF